jgi:hypothetical protein
VTASPIESFLARLYLDEDARVRFAEDPRGAALAAGLSGDAADQAARLDPAVIEMAAQGFARKRAHRRSEPPAPSGSRAGWFRRLFR